MTLRHSFPRPILLTIQTILMGLGILLIVVTFTPVDEWWARRLAGPLNDPRGDVLIVLGASALEDGVIGESTYWRSVYALRAWRGGTFHAIVLSGGGPAKSSVAEAMLAFLVSQGVPREAIWVESQSRSTRENALFAQPILDTLAGSKVLLTSDYHMFRAYHAFQKAGVRVLPRPVPDVEKRAGHLLLRWDAFLDLGMETTKIGYYYFRGWI